MSIKDIARENRGNYYIKPELIQVKEGFNARIDTEDLQAHIESLARSIATRGIEVPLAIFMEGDAPILTDGHCRLLAVPIANEKYGAEIQEVPIVLESKLYNDADRKASLLTRNSAFPLSLLEKAGIVGDLLAFEWSEEKIMETIGCSISHVKDLRLLSTASEAVRELIVNDTVSATNAVEAIRKFGAKAGEALTEAVKMANKQGRKKVTEKQTQPAFPWKKYGPLLREALENLLFKSDGEELKNHYTKVAEDLIFKIREEDHE